MGSQYVLLGVNLVKDRIVKASQVSDVAHGPLRIWAITQERLGQSVSNLSQGIIGPRATIYTKIRVGTLKQGEIIKKTKPKVLVAKKSSSPEPPGRFSPNLHTRIRIC